MNLTQKILSAHLVEGQLIPGQEIAIRIDQTLTQDSTGTMAYLQFEALGIGQVKTKRSVAYIDHNTLQAGFENADDHMYIQTVTGQHGIYCSKPGNGICHQVHLERFGVPGMTLLGSDSHTPTGGGIGMIAIGAGGLDVALAMGGAAYHTICPKVTAVRLTGKLQHCVTAKDVILEVLRRISVKGGVGRILEYTGEGVSTLSVPERATIANMGAETGATTSVFPADEVTRSFLKSQGREQDYQPLYPDADAVYDEEIEIDLSELVPLVAKPHMPDLVDTVEDVGKIAVDQVFIGSCTNSSYQDMMRVAKILKGKTVNPNVSLVIGPGSRQVLTMLARNGALADMMAAGARILETACGPCIGMGQSPRTGAVSLRTNNRNFYARSGTASASIYLVSCETAAVSALTGCLTDPRAYAPADLNVEMPEQFECNDNLIVLPVPEAEADNAKVVRGPNIKPFPLGHALENDVSGSVLLKMEDNITTDHIMPSNAKLLPYRSNVPHLSRFAFSPVDETLSERAVAAGGGILVAGSNYGQGSSREHAALVLVQLGIRAVIAKSFARIHKDNLMNNGVLPLVFADESDYDAIEQGHVIVLQDIGKTVQSGDETIKALDETTGKTITLKLECTPRQRSMLLYGGAILEMKEHHA